MAQLRLGLFARERLFGYSECLAYSLVEGSLCPINVVGWLENRFFGSASPIGVSPLGR